MAKQDATFGRNHSVWFSTASSLVSENGIGLLRLYVEKYTYSPEEADSSEKLRRLKAHIEQYEEQIHAFLIRDIETENLRHENMRLTAEISNLQTHNKNLEKQYARMLKEVQKLRSQLAGQPGHVIELSFSK